MVEIFNFADYPYNLHSVPYIISGLIALFFGIFIFLKSPFFQDIFYFSNNTEIGFLIKEKK